MRRKFLIPGLMALSIGCWSSCKSASDKKSAEKQEAAVAKVDEQNKVMEENRKKVDALNHDYPRIPVEGKLLENGENPCYNELKQRYKEQLTKFKQDVESTGAKFVLIMLSPGADNKTNPSDKYSNPFIRATAGELGCEFLDFAPIIAAQDIREITQAPKDGHWSKKGAKLIADHLAGEIKKFPDAACKTTYKDNERPETFGDLPPNDDEVLDGGKDLPYHVKANSQGVRMDHDLTFPKKKKRVLIMGDSGLFCPFLDNEFTIAYVLQQQFPDYEIYATAQVNWTTEDYLTLWHEKTKFTEPDIVILGTNASDVEDLFFTNRNHCSRSGKPFYPSATETKFYNDNYK
jgi:hypothetical protein